jgi:hypothetical protein
LTLDHSDIHQPTRTIAQLNGLDVLWRGDGFEEWKKERKPCISAVMIRVEGLKDRPTRDQFPCIDLLKPAATKLPLREFPLP